MVDLLLEMVLTTDMINTTGLMITHLYVKMTIIIISKSRIRIVRNVYQKK